MLSKFPAVLEAAHDRFQRLLVDMPEPEWTFDTTAAGVDEIASALLDALLD